MKIAITLLLILALAAAAFFVGWVQLALPAGAYGVAFTKSGGWDTAAIAPGGVSWRWERLIPTNMTLYVFDLTPQRVERRRAARLPSAELYASEASEVGIDIDADDLSYDVGITVRLRLRPDHLPRLAAEADLRPETLPAWYGEQAAAAVDAAVAALLSRDAAALVIDPQALRERTRRWLAGRSPELEIVEVELTAYSIPDVDLYARAKAAVAERIDTQHRARLAVIEDSALAGEQARQHAVMLRRLGSTLADYPELGDLLSSSPADLLGQVLGVTMAGAAAPRTPQEPPAGP